MIKDARKDLNLQYNVLNLWLREWNEFVIDTQPSKKSIHNTKIVIPTSVHRRITGYYNSKPGFTRGKTVRQWLSTHNYDAQYKYGMDIMDKAIKGTL